MPKEPYSLLFVCLGNICRSPLAEGVFRSLVEQKGHSTHFVIDSCGTGNWHVGELPHKDSRRIAKKYGVSLEGQRARQVAPGDFKNFELILGMDSENVTDLVALDSRRQSKIKHLREYDPEGKDLDVPDPYWGGADGFETVYQIISRSCEVLLEELLDELKLR